MKINKYKYNYTSTNIKACLVTAGRELEVSYTPRGVRQAKSFRCCRIASID